MRWRRLSWWATKAAKTVRERLQKMQRRRTTCCGVLGASRADPCHARCARGPAGEKRLKSLLSKTPQWRSKDERAAAAAACDASGYANLASVLRNDVTSAALRKRDMIALARHWSYRSHIWRCVQRSAQLCNGWRVRRLC